MNQVKIIKFYCPLFILLLLAGCRGTNPQKAVYVNSYHQGYVPADEITAGIEKWFSSGKIELIKFYLDSKRLSGEQLTQRTDSITQLIVGINPDILIASDDYSVKYVAVPYSKESGKPVVFCGVNWSAEQYDLPCELMTGMLEVLPLKESLLFAKANYPRASRIAVLSENSLSEHNNKLLLDTLYRNAGFEPVYMMVNDFEEWKSAFISANTSEDVIYLPTNGSIKGWNNEEAGKFVGENIRKPVFTCDDFMMDYCVFGFTKVAEEQGNWAAQTAIQILGGKKPADIPMIKNSQKKVWFNKSLARVIGFSPDSSWIVEANIINQ